MPPWHVFTCAPTHVDISPSQLPLKFGYPPSGVQEKRLWRPLCWVCLFGCVVNFPRIKSLESQCAMLSYAQVNSVSGFPLPIIPFVFTVCNSSHEEQSCCLQIKYHINKLTRVENIWQSWCMLLNVNTIWNHLFNYCILGCDDRKSKYPVKQPKREKKEEGQLNKYICIYVWDEELNFDDLDKLMADWNFHLLVNYL